MGSYILTFTTQELYDLLYMAKDRNDKVQIAYNPTTKTWQTSFGPLATPHDEDRPHWFHVPEPKWKADGV